MATKTYHIRRYHVCGTVNELAVDEGASGEATAERAVVQKCSHCHKHLAPYYFFEESGAQGLTDNRLEMSLWSKASSYNPIWGLSTYWEEDPDGYIDETG